MNWSNVRLILAREIRDQLRDRRTLFMIAVLPLVLYPLMGMSFFQVVQFMREHAIRVLVVGAPEVPGLPPLVEGDRFADDLFPRAEDSQLLQVTTQVESAPHSGPESPLDRARRDMLAGNYEVVVFIPPDFAEKHARFHDAIVAHQGAAAAAADMTLPRVEIYPNLANDASKAAYRRVADVLDRWRESIGRQNLAASQLPPSAARPFEIDTVDVAEAGQRKAVLWSKILPFVLLLWALTGAFYPAIDLCAGEKERGTLETLLSSPAERIEIVWGKLLTIMLFSMATAILNLASMGIAGSLVLSQLPDFGPPPSLAFVWLLLALVPVSALFSALCLALAAFARSTKEGQYYLMPLVLVTMPLTILPMAPGVELNIGNSLIPVTGVMLLLRDDARGQLSGGAALYSAGGCSDAGLLLAGDSLGHRTIQHRERAVSRERALGRRTLVPALCCAIARQRPVSAEAMFCGVLILMVRFFLSFSACRCRATFARIRRTRVA